jgi:uncharacterized protein
MMTAGQKPDALRKMSAALAGGGMAPLTGCTPDGLARELADNGAKWAFGSKVDVLKNRTVLIITSDDGFAEANTSLATDLRKAGNTGVTTVHLATDHVYSDQRIELSHAVLQWLASLPTK